MGHLIEKKYQVTGHYLCMKYTPRYPVLRFWRVCNGGIRRYGRLQEDTWTQLQYCLLWVWGHISDNNFVLCGTIFFIHVPNDLYSLWILADIRYLRHPLAAGTQTIIIKSQE